MTPVHGADIEYTVATIVIWSSLAAFLFALLWRNGL